MSEPNFLRALYDPGLITTQGGTVAQVCSALPLSSKSSSTQQLYRYSRNTCWRFALQSDPLPQQRKMQWIFVSFLLSDKQMGLHSSSSPLLFLNCSVICGQSGIPNQATGFIPIMQIRINTLTQFNHHLHFYFFSICKLSDEIISEHVFFWQNNSHWL